MMWAVLLAAAPVPEPLAAVGEVVASVSVDTGVGAVLRRDGLLVPAFAASGRKEPWVGPPRPRRRLARLEVLRRDVRPVALAVFEERLPDERVLDLLLFDGEGAVLEATAVVGTGTVAAGPFGEVRPDVELRRLPGGDEVVWVLGATSLTLDGSAGPVRVPVARRERRLGPTGFGPEQQVALASPLLPDEVELGRVAAELYGAPEPRAAVDGDLNTAWRFSTAGLDPASAGLPSVEPPRSSDSNLGPATLLLKWRDPVTAHLLRIVPGCLGAPGRWARHHEVRAFRVELSSGRVLDVDRDRPGIPPGVFAARELPLGEGRQILLLGLGGEPLRWARIRVTRTGRGDGTGPKVPEACVTEVGWY